MRVTLLPGEMRVVLMFDDEYTVTLRHSHILHSAMNLVYSRFEFLEQSKRQGRLH